MFQKSETKPKNSKLIPLIIGLSLVFLSTIFFIKSEAIAVISEEEISTNKTRPVVIIIDENTYNQTKSEIDRFKTDIENDLSTEVIINTNSWENANELRIYLKNLYQKNGLRGVILIGDAPTQCYSANLNVMANSSFPSDYLYMDLTSSVGFDGEGCINKIEINREDEIFKRDIWAGRIKPPVDDDEGISLLKNYFDRNHRYRTGEISYNRGLLFYPHTRLADGYWTESICQTESEQIISENTAYDLADVTIICSAGSQGRELYLNELSENREWIAVNVHGNQLSQSFKPVIEWFNIKNNQPKALFYSLLSCSNGYFTMDNYIAGWYLFSGDGLIVYGYTVPVFSRVEQGLNTDLLLSSGMIFGETIKYDSSQIFTLLGDPTLKMREPENVPNIKLNKTDVNFGNVKIGETKEIYINITNQGSEDFIFSKNYLSKFIKIPENENRTEAPISAYIFSNKVPPNSSGNIKLYFKPDKSGEYLIKYIFTTNDPEYPFLEINLKGVGVIKEGPEATLDLNDSYSQGEKITIKVVNKGNTDIYYSASGCLGDFCSTSYNIIQKATNKKVTKSDPCLPVPTIYRVIKIKAGETKIIDEWEQKDWEVISSDSCESVAKQVALGTYKISFTYATDEMMDALMVIEKEIMIESPVCIKEGTRITSIGQKCCPGLEKINDCQLTESGECICATVPGGATGYCTNCGDGICKPPENKCNCPADCEVSQYSQITEQWCDAKNPCPQGLECYSFPGLGLRCVQPNPCSYFKCPKGTQCGIAESYPGQVMCSCVGPACPASSEDEQTVSYDLLTQTMIQTVNKEGQSISREASLWKASSGNKGILETISASVECSNELIVEESKLFMKTSVGKVVINVMPEEAIAVSETPKSVRKIELKEESEKPVYSVEGIKKKRILFIFPVNLEIETKISAKTGKVIGVKKPWWSFLAW